MKLPHRVADGLTHPPHLAVAALVQDELETRWAEQPDTRRRRDPVVELDAACQPACDGVRGPSLDVGDIGLLDPVPRMREAMRQLPVVREEQDTGRVRVEATDGCDASRRSHERDHRRTPLRITNRRHDTGGLVQDEVSQRLCRDAPAVDLDDVRAGDRGVELAGGPVHPHPAGPDEIVGSTARGESGTREKLVQAHRFILIILTAIASARMADHAELTRRLAELIVGFGANVQPGRVLGVTTETGKEEMTRAVVHAAYRRGARWVDVLTHDPWVKRARLDLAAADTLAFVPQWMVERLEWLSDEHAARITLRGPSNPMAHDGVDPARTGRDLLPYLPNSGDVVNRRTTSWCVAPAPTREWAQLVHPDLPAEDAYDRLWEAIAHVCRLDADDPAEAWRRRGLELETTADRLTQSRFDAIQLRGPGTDLTVGLFRSSAWHAGDSETADGISHFSNIPTEETFTTPDPTRVEGVVTATRPLVMHGSLIEGIRIAFEGGRAVRIEAERGADALRAAAARDDGASRLGELALVDGGGRIGPLDTVFYDTLIDENAASHIALGSAYLTPVEDETERRRANKSEIHVDFMIGGPELLVDGVTTGGERVPLLRGGAWQL